MGDDGMKLSDYRKVAALLTQRESLWADHIKVNNSANDNGALGVTIQGRYQQWDILEPVKPVVLAVLEKRIALIDEQLTKLGVEID
jgi:hypothetical protein